MKVHIFTVILPLILSNVLHMLMVKNNALSLLAIPIWKKGFGNNKTWRGMLFLPICNAIFLFAIDGLLQQKVDEPIVLGAILGLVYMLSELPNSFVKRRLGIKSGERAENYHFVVQLIDKMDSAIGVTLTYFVLGYTDVQTALLLFLLASGTHIFVSYILVLLKIKKSF